MTWHGKIWHVHDPASMEKAKILTSLSTLSFFPHFMCSLTQEKACSRNEDPAQPKINLKRKWVRLHYYLTWQVRDAKHKDTPEAQRCFMTLVTWYREQKQKLPRAPSQAGIYSFLAILFSRNVNNPCGIPEFQITWINDPQTKILSRQMFTSSLRRWLPLGS